MRLAFRTRLTIASTLTTLFVLNAFALEAVPTSRASVASEAISRSTQVATAPVPTTQIAIDTLPVEDPPGVSFRTAIGTPYEATVTVSALPRASAASRSRRLVVEDQDIAETIDIDAEKGEIRAFGMTFRPQLDAISKTPIGLTLSSGAASVDLTEETDLDQLTVRQRVAASRLNKIWASTQVRDRAQKTYDVLKRAQAERHVGGRVQAQDFACLWDVITLFMDWLFVVIACGPGIILPIGCFLAIAWATADTMVVVSNMPRDCGL
jgi:hypothetical protein